MKILTAYIVKEILKGSMVAMLILVTLVNLFTFRDQLKKLGQGSYDLQEIILYVTLTTPKVFFELMPSSALLGSLFVLGAMANNREIVAMRAAGVSLLNLIKSVLLAGAVLVMLSFTVGELVAPITEKSANILKIEARSENKQAVWQSFYGFWLRDGDLFINVREIKGEGVLADVSIYQLNEQDRVQRFTHAESARYKGKKSWLLEQVRETEISPSQVTSSEMDKKDWQSSISPNLLDIVVLDPGNMSLYDLAMYIQFLKKNNQKAETFEFAFWGRLVNPFITLVMLLVSVPFIIRLQKAQSAGLRMMIGIVFGMGFLIFDRITSHVGLIYDLNPIIIAFFPGALVFSGAVYAISRLR